MFETGKERDSVGSSLTRPGRARVLVLVHKATDYGFPSNHAAVAVAVVAGLLFSSRRLGWLAVALAVLMAGARVYVGVHYPADVLAGLTLGGGIAAVGWLAGARLLVAGVDWVGGTPLRGLVARTGAFRTVSW